MVELVIIKKNYVRLYRGTHLVNENCSRLIEFCEDNSLQENVFFSNKRIHKLTFEGERKNPKSIVDHILYLKTFNYKITDVKVIRSAEIELTTSF